MSICAKVWADNTLGLNNGLVGLCLEDSIIVVYLSTIFMNVSSSRVNFVSNKREVDQYIRSCSRKQSPTTLRQIAYLHVS